MLDHCDGTSCLVAPPQCPINLSYSQGKQQLTLPPAAWMHSVGCWVVVGVGKPVSGDDYCVQGLASPPTTLAPHANPKDLEMDCDIIVRTGTGIVQWWAKLTKYAVQNRYESWAAQWLVVLKGWVCLTLFCSWWLPWIQSRGLIFLFVGFTHAGLPDDNWQKKQLVAVEAEIGSDASGDACWEMGQL